MKERSQQLFSEAGENLDYLRDNLRELSEYITELEALIEEYRAHLQDDTLNSKTPMMERITRRTDLLMRTEALFGEEDEEPHEEP
jgi:hypothetical protein